MTRQEFLDNVENFSDLIVFCCDEGCDICDDVVDSDYWDEWIDDNLVDWARNDSWRDLMSRLNELDEDSGYTFYIYDDYYCEYKGVDDDGDDFDRYKSEVLDWADEHGCWEEDEEEEEEEEPAPYRPYGFSDTSEEEEEDEDPTPDEDCSFDDLIAVAVGCVASFNEETIRKAQEEDRVFMEFQKFGR